MVLANVKPGNYSKFFLPNDGDVHGKLAPMLKLNPESNLATAIATETDDVVNCAACGHLVTRLRWATTKNGHHKHEFMNLAGFAFLIQCFSEASGASTHGPAARRIHMVQRV